MFKGNNNAATLTVYMENLTLIMNYDIITCGILYEKTKTFFIPLEFLTFLYEPNYLHRYFLGKLSAL